MRIAFLSNPIAGGWHPDDLDTFLGGNEECLLLLARALAKGHAVKVFTTLRGAEYNDDHGVMWRQREKFYPEMERDVFISWKDRDIWRHPINAKVKIHASQDVEAPLPLEQIDYVTVLGTYHSERLPWVPAAKKRIVPLGISRRYAPPKEELREEVALYATSPDRGLDQLLRDWARIRESRPHLSLLITYDWNRLSTMSGVHGATYARHLELWCDQPGIDRRTLTAVEMRHWFQQASYYIHPLPRPDADLFGFGAMKAQACGCTLVLPALDNGFRDMALQWIPYSRFVEGDTLPLFNPRYCRRPESWDTIVAKYWAPLLEGK